MNYQRVDVCMGEWACLWSVGSVLAKPRTILKSA
jgi:hypothetical protein